MKKLITILMIGLSSLVACSETTDQKEKDQEQLIILLIADSYNQNDQETEYTIMPPKEDMKIK